MNVMFQRASAAAAAPHLVAPTVFFQFPNCGYIVYSRTLFRHGVIARCAVIVADRANTYITRRHYAMAVHALIHTRN